MIAAFGALGDPNPLMLVIALEHPVPLTTSLTLSTIETDTRGCPTTFDAGFVDEADPVDSVAPGPIRLTDVDPLAQAAGVHTRLT